MFQAHPATLRGFCVQFTVNASCFGLHLHKIDQFKISYRQLRSFPFIFYSYFQIVPLPSTANLQCFVIDVNFLTNRNTN